MLHQRRGMGLTQARGHEPLAVAMQGTVDVEDVLELLKEARVSIMEVRKVHTSGLIRTIEDIPFINAQGADLKR